MIDLFEEPSVAVAVNVMPLEPRPVLGPTRLLLDCYLQKQKYLISIYSRVYIYTYIVEYSYTEPNYTSRKMQ